MRYFKVWVTGLLLAAASVFIAAPVLAQEEETVGRVWFGAGFGPGFPVGEFSDEDEAGASEGLAYGARSGYQIVRQKVSPMFYAGYWRHGFGTDEAIPAEVDFSLPVDAIEVGTRIIFHPFSSRFRGELSNPDFFLDGSLGFYKQRVEISGEGLDLDLDVNLDRTVGFGVGGGVTLVHRKHWALDILAKYHRFSSDLPEEGGDDGERLTTSFFSVNLNISGLVPVMGSSRGGSQGM